MTFNNLFVSLSLHCCAALFVPEAWSKWIWSDMTLPTTDRILFVNHREGIYESCGCFPWSYKNASRLFSLKNPSIADSMALSVSIHSANYIEWSFLNSETRHVHYVLSHAGGATDVIDLGAIPGHLLSAQASHDLSYVCYTVNTDDYSRRIVVTSREHPYEILKDFKIPRSGEPILHWNSPVSWHSCLGSA